MSIDPISADIVRMCEAAGLTVDTVDKLPTGISTVYVACIYPPDVPEPDSVTVRRVARQQYAIRYWIRAARDRDVMAWAEELDRLVFEVADTPDAGAP